MKTALLEADRIRHRYAGSVDVLEGISFSLSGGTTALVGVNGAGKSTLLSVMAGSLKPTSGRAVVSGIELYGSRRRQVLGNVALMPQNLSLPGNLTALEVVSVLAWMRGLSGATVQRRAREALAVVGLEDRSDTQVRRLSGGMRRRVALAQAVCAHPDVLVLDEPSTGLDPEQRREMVQLVKSLGATVLFSSHVMEDVVDVADRVIVLHAGRIVFDGALAKLESRAPDGTLSSRRAEAGFLSIIASAGVPA